MDFEEALENFSKALGDLKRSFAERTGSNPNYISVSVDQDNIILIVPTFDHGMHYVETYKDWLSVDL